MKKIYLVVVLFLALQLSYSQNSTKDLSVLDQHFKSLQKKSEDTPTDFKEWKVTSTASSLKKGLTHYYVTQYYKGIPIVNATSNLSVFNNKINFEKNQFITESEVESKLDILVEGQTNNSKELQAIRNDLQKGFIGLALRNKELLRSSDQLKQQLDEVLKELNLIKQEREERAARKEARANRKRLPKRGPMTAAIYKELIKEAEEPTHIHVRTRIALCLDRKSTRLNSSHSSVSRMPSSA